MRCICCSLLAANLVLLAYIISEPDQKNSSHDAGVVMDSRDRVKGTTLVLLSELVDDKRQVEPVEAVRLGRVKPENGALSSRALCTLVGSFTDIAKARLFVERLAVFDIQSKVKHLLVSNTVGYWLHLPPLGSRKELLQRLGDLQRQGVDSYIIPDGELENGISLGMFSESDRAKALQSKVAELGHQTEILEVPREKREIWVFLQQRESTKINQTQWSELISGKDLLQKQQNLCSDVASR